METISMYSKGYLELYYTNILLENQVEIIPNSVYYVICSQFWQRQRPVQTDDCFWLDRPTDALETSVGPTGRGGPRRSSCCTHCDQKILGKHHRLHWFDST